MAAPRRLNLSGAHSKWTVDYAKLVDDGPFYQRYWVKGRRGDGATGHGFAEVVRPELVDLGWQRPFVRMRTHSLKGQNSLFLPLFNGPLDGGWRRLADYWRSA